MFITYISGLSLHAATERTKSATVQLLGGTLVYIHSYLTVSHPALAARHAPIGRYALWFLVYSVVFGCMTHVIREERKHKDD